MRFIYGKQDWCTMERGQENCYLLTNGLGGFSSGTIIGSAARNDHALLMACLKAPNNRIHMITKVEEKLEVNGKITSLATQEYGSRENDKMGYQHLNSFIFDTIPQWCYQANGVEIIKKIAMKSMENTLALYYTIDNYTDTVAEFIVKPCFQFVKKGDKMEDTQILQMDENSVSSNGMTLYYKTDGRISSFPTEYESSLFYAYDACDGRTCDGCTASNHDIRFTVNGKEKKNFSIVYSTRPVAETAKAIIDNAVIEGERLICQADIKSPVGCELVKSANSFIVNRDSTKGKSMIAGYPFFEDWGRDTMIAVTGCCIVTKQFEDAKSIFRTFMKYCKKGIMPNLFPEGDNPPMYNTADASLLFINAVYEYYLASLDTDFVKEAFPVMEDILEWYQKGTDFEIFMDEDGLISAGSGYDQLTWMDVRIGEVLPTPRHGKSVEINAYWYNCLRIMEEFSGIMGINGLSYLVLSDKVRDSFRKCFWNPEKGCINDLYSGEKADEQIRCNQIWAVSLPYTMLSAEQERKVVDTVYEKLYTPYGLRTLSMDDPEFQPFYGGAQEIRDLAYHQGTIWAFPLGAYYLAYLKVHQYSEESINTVKRQTEVLESCLREGCIGQIPEIYDGGNPGRSKGCFAQAWSVAELLRVFQAID